MVYNFYFDEGDVTQIKKEMPARNAGLASSLFFSPDINSNRLMERRTFRVDEVYTTAKEWQEELSSAKKSNRGQVATQHYRDIFGI